MDKHLSCSLTIASRKQSSFLPAFPAVLSLPLNDAAFFRAGADNVDKKQQTPKLII